MRSKAFKPFIIFFLPALILLILVGIYPFILTLYLSFTEYILFRGGGPKFIGLSNYINVLFDAEFYMSTLRAMYFTMLSLAIQLPLGIILAIALYTIRRLKSFFCTLILVPFALPPIVVAIIFRMMYDPVIGVINYILKCLGLGEHLWLGSPVEVIPSLAIIDSYIWTPFVTLVLLSGLNTVPKEIIEAAYIDGAPYKKVITCMLLPLIKKYILIVLCFRLIYLISVFDIILPTTAGGPGNASQTLYYYAYVTAFQYLNFGYSAVLNIFIYLILLVVTLILIRKGMTLGAES